MNEHKTLDTRTHKNIYHLREILAIYILTHFSTRSFGLVKIHMSLAKFI